MLRDKRCKKDTKMGSCAILCKSAKLRLIDQPGEGVMQIETWPVNKLVEYARNPRKNDHAVDRIASAIREFGFRVPVVAKSDGSLVDGHLRLKAAKKLGMEEVPVILADDMTEAQIKAFRISVNRMAEFAEWDNELLALEFDELKSMDFDLELTGFTLDEIGLLSPVFEPASEDEQGRLDQLEPKWIACPNCGKEFDFREA